MNSYDDAVIIEQNTGLRSTCSSRRMSSFKFSNDRRRLPACILVVLMA
jgi:hypothetical protein